MSDVQIEIIDTASAPRLDLPLSQAIRYGDLIFTSGQIPIDSATGEFVGGSIENQTRRVLDNISAILDASGSSLSHVLKVTVFLTDVADFQAFNGVYREYFGTHLPARSTFRVELAGPFGLEIEALAAIKKNGGNA